jgi:hypothetical protein
MLLEVLDFYIGTAATFFFISTFWIFYDTALYRFFTASAILLALFSSPFLFSSNAYARSLIRPSISYYLIVSCCLILIDSEIDKFSLSSAFSFFYVVNSLSTLAFLSLVSALNRSS